MSISSKRWNQLINAANCNKSPSDVQPPLANDEERKTYSDLIKELAKYREISPNAAFSPIELDWDEEFPDIYRE